MILTVEPRSPLRYPPVERFSGFGVERHLPVGVPLAASDNLPALARGDRQIVRLEGGELLQAQRPRTGERWAAGPSQWSGILDRSLPDSSRAPGVSILSPRSKAARAITKAEMGVVTSKNAAMRIAL